MSSCAIRLTRLDKAEGTGCAKGKSWRAEKISSQAKN
jgi:hypothetical protein